MLSELLYFYLLFKFMIGLRSVLTVLKGKCFLQIQPLIMRILVKQDT